MLVTLGLFFGIYFIYCLSFYLIGGHLPRGTQRFTNGGPGWWETKAGLLLSAIGSLFGTSVIFNKTKRKKD
jgi:hypothetical protein